MEHLRKNAQFVVRPQFEIIPINGDDDVIEQRYKLKIQKIGLDRQLNELLLFLSSYPELKECFYDHIRRANEQEWPEFRQLLPQEAEAVEAAEEPLQVRNHFLQLEFGKD